MKMPILKAQLAFCSNKCSLTSKSTVCNEVRNIICESNVGRSYASSLPCEMPNLSKNRRRVSKEERRSMVESFVNKYRATNAGNFPPLTVTHKEVGGAYYVVRKILQELEHEYRTSFSTSKNEVITQQAKVLSGVKEARVKNDACVLALNNEEANDTYDEHVEAADRRLPIFMVSSDEIVMPTFPAQDNQLRGDQLNASHSAPAEQENANNPPNDNSDIITTVGYPLERQNETVSDKYLERGGDGLSHLLARPTKVVSDACFKNADPREEKGRSEIIQTSESVEQNEQTVGSSHLGSTSFDGTNEKAVSQKLMHSDSREPKVEGYQRSSELGSVGPKTESYDEEAVPEGTRLGKTARGISERKSDGILEPKKSDLWTNLKLLADGIINIWRKR